MITSIRMYIAKLTGRPLVTDSVRVAAVRKLRNGVTWVMCRQGRFRKVLGVEWSGANGFQVYLGRRFSAERLQMDLSDFIMEYAPVIIRPLPETAAYDLVGTVVCRPRAIGKPSCHLVTACDGGRILVAGLSEKYLPLEEALQVLTFPDGTPLGVVEKHRDWER